MFPIAEESNVFLGFAQQPDITKVFIDPALGISFTEEMNSCSL